MDRPQLSASSAPRLGRPGGALNPAASIEEFVRHPQGSYVVGQCWLAFRAAGGGFGGWILWGEPTEQDVTCLVATAQARLTLEPSSPVWIDVRNVRRGDRLAFSVLLKWAGGGAGGSQLQGISRLALVHDGGLVGAIAAGFLAVIQLPFPAQAFAEVCPALAWLGCAADAPLVDEVERLRVQFSRRDPIIEAMASLLEARPRSTLAEVSQRLGLSRRSLQRRLTQSGTCFRAELDLARMRLAQRLLRDSDASLQRVAYEAGCASPQHFSRLFRKIVDETPGAWRRAVTSARYSPPSESVESSEPQPRPPPRSAARPEEPR